MMHYTQRLAVLVLIGLSPLAVMAGEGPVRRGTREELRQRALTQHRSVRPEGPQRATTKSGTPSPLTSMSASQTSTNDIDEQIARLLERLRRSDEQHQKNAGDIKTLFEKHIEHDARLVQLNSDCATVRDAQRALKQLVPSNFLTVFQALQANNEQLIKRVAALEHERRVSVSVASSSLGTSPARSESPASNVSDDAEDRLVPSAPPSPSAHS